MSTNLFFVRPGVTPLHLEGLVVGSQDVDMSDEGLAQARRAVDAVVDHEVTEVISSPLSRALQTANLFAQRHGIDITRDSRLAAVSHGEWERRPLAELEASQPYRDFVAGRTTEHFTSEALGAVAQRARASVQQALVDNPSGSNIVVISHRVPLALLLAEYLQLPPAAYHRIALDPGSISVVRLSGYPHRSSVVATNWRGGDLALATS